MMTGTVAAGVVKAFWELLGKMILPWRMCVFVAPAPLGTMP